MFKKTISNKYYLWFATVLSGIVLNVSNYKWLLQNMYNSDQSQELPMWLRVIGVIFMVLLLVSVVFGIRDAIKRKPKWILSLIVPFLIFGMHFLPWIEYCMRYFHPTMDI